MNSVLSSVEETMRKFEVWIHEVKQSNMDTEMVVEVMRQQVRDLSQVVQND